MHDQNQFIPILHFIFLIGRIPFSVLNFKLFYYFSYQEAWNGPRCHTEVVVDVACQLTVGLKLDS